jgi:hypothetical protein
MKLIDVDASIVGGDIELAVGNYGRAELAEMERDSCLTAVPQQL